MKNDKAISLLIDLRDKGCEIWVEEGKLKIRAPRKGLTEEVRQKISNEKLNLLTLLKSSHRSQVSSRIQSRKNDIDYYPLSYFQERLWFINNLEEESDSSYNQYGGLALLGPLNISALRDAFSALLARHKMLRSRFLINNNQPVQIISDSLELDIPIVSIERENIKDYIHSFNEHIFDLVNDEPLIKVSLLKTGDKNHILLCNLHHIICDGWSIENILTHDFKNFYKAYSEGVPNSLAPLEIQYTDYACWQRQQDFTKEKEYWENHLFGYEGGLELPRDHQKSPEHGRCTAYVKHQYPVDFSKSLERFSQENSMTLFMVLFAGFSLVVSRRTRREDICLGVTTAGRHEPALEGLIGFFINILPLRIQVSESMTVLDYIESVREAIISGFECQQIPFEKILSIPSLQLSNNSNSLVPLILRHQNYPRTSLSDFSDTLQIDFLPPDYLSEENAVLEKTPKCDMDLMFYGDGKDLSVIVEYAADLFNQDSVKKLLKHHHHILESIISSTAETRVSELQMYDQQELKTLLSQWNQTDRILDSRLCVPQLFEQQVALTPNAIACHCEDRSLSYAELNKHANQLGCYLKNIGVVAETTVGICLERSEHYLIALLGIMKAGGAYVPLDPRYPTEYLGKMIENASTRWIISDQKKISVLPTNTAEIICLNKLDTTLATCSSETPSSALKAENLAYILYTSGSTGEPKGVQVTHKQILNCLQGLWDQYPIEVGEVYAQKTTASFAVSVKELFAGLLKGSAVAIIPDDAVKDAELFAQKLADFKVSRLNIVPSHLRILLDEVPEINQKLSNLKYCTTAGEPLTRDLAERFKEYCPQAKLLNNYGCTELNDTTYYEVEQLEKGERFIPIGYPIQNTKTYVLDKVLNPVPEGVAGELYVESAGLARGYHKQGGLTAERFVPNPFSDQPGRRLYNTGDIVKRLNDGSLEYLGRWDFQVKIRGFRIDIRQIEKMMSTYPAFAAWAVHPWEKGGYPAQLVGYYVKKSVDIIVSVSDLREHLLSRLPDYMVPALYTELEALPVLPNGKLNRRGFPTPVESDLMLDKYEAPQTSTEKALVQIWSQVLGVEVNKIGRHVNFFELGGDSLVLIRITSKILDHFSAKVPLNVFLNSPILTDVAMYIDRQPDVRYLSDCSDAGMSYANKAYALLPMQQWFFERIAGKQPNHWNEMTRPEIPRKNFNLDILRKVVTTLMEHHEALRMCIKNSKGAKKWVVYEKFREPPVEYFDFSNHEENSETHVLDILQSFQLSLNLSNGPIFKIGVFDFGDPDQIRLMFIFHHLAVDMYSLEIFFNDFRYLYDNYIQGKTPKSLKKTTTYMELSRVLEEYSNSENLVEEVKKYWFSENQQIPFSIPVDFDEYEKNIESSVRKFINKIPRVKSEILLKKVKSNLSINISDMILTAIILEVSRWAGKERIRVDIWNHGRNLDIEGIDLSRTIGWCNMNYPIMFFVKPNIASIEAYHSVKNQLSLVPKGGFIYPLLRYMRNDKDLIKEMHVCDTSEINYNYLGLFEGKKIERNIDNENNIFSKVINREQNTLRPYLMPFDAYYTKEGDVYIEILYSENMHKRTSIQLISDNVIKNLCELIDNLEND